MVDNVIRRDVIEVSVETDKSGLIKLNSEMDKLKASVTGEVGKGLDDLKNSVKGLGNVSVGKFKESFDKIKESADKAKKATESVGDSAKKMSRFTSTFKSVQASILSGENALNKFKSSIRNLPSNAVSKISDSFTKARFSAAAFTASIKAIAKQKVGNLKTDISATAKALTGGQTGARGFVTALKSIGKISIGKVASGIGKIKDSLPQAKAALSNFGAKLKDVAKTSMSKLASGLKKVGSALGSIATKAAGAAFNGLKKVASVSFKALGVGLAGATAAIGALVKASVSAYSSNEQLVGGVQTLFGTGGANSVEEYAKSVGKSVAEVQDKYNVLKKSESAVITNANNAYKTAQMSANDYMETVTGFSASLLQSLGGDTQKAAEKADKALVQMSDNSAKMGSDMESIKYAYQGFAKQNYTINYLMSAA